MDLHILPEEETYHNEFRSSSKKHILMITNHGIHEWKIMPGLPDTGGQNIFVNQFTNQLAKMGFKITIFNRGGFTHPISGEKQKGFRYRDENRRILYIKDGNPSFVRKEDMPEQVLSLTHFIYTFIQSTNETIHLMISHYWDAAKIGAELNERLEKPIKHIWLPHSLGEVKKRHLEPDKWKELRIDERIAIEKTLIPKLDSIVSTSALITQSLAENYRYSNPLNFPPCINTDRYFKRSVSDIDPIWDFLSQCSTLEPGEIRECKIITEISRTDTTKRKDILLQAFLEVHEEYPDTFLIISIDQEVHPLYDELCGLITNSRAQKHIAVVGSVWAYMPLIYSVTDIYCTPSVMEGFGMSAQEAAATGVPVISSDLVPFVTEYLMGKSQRRIPNHEGKSALIHGEGAITVPANDVSGFALGIKTLLKDEPLRKKMGAAARSFTVPYFSWDSMSEKFMNCIGFHA